jgi:hypothetical protein
MSSPQPILAASPLQLLKELRGLFFEFSGDEDSVSLAAASKRLDVGTDWLRTHLHEFPHAWRLPAGSTKLGKAGEERNVGELRIPLGDLRAFEARQRVRKEPA